MVKISDEKLLALFRASRLFSAIDKKTSKQLLTKFSLIEIAKDDILFSQGDRSSSIYLLISGQLIASLTTASGESRKVGVIHEGETVGELGAISNEPRTLTIRASKASQLLKLPAKQFIDMSHRYPSIMFATLHPIIARSRSIIQMLSAKKRNKHIVIISANAEISLKEFTKALSVYARRFQTLMILSDYDQEFANKEASQSKVRTNVHKRAVGKKSAKRFIYISQSYDSPLAQFGLRNADLLYIVGDSQSEPKIHPDILNYVKSRKRKLRNPPNLIMLHEQNAQKPTNTAPWLRLLDFQLYHHVRISHVKDYARLLRFMRGKAVGLVLGGGGTRGWSHLGVIKALRDNKVPIDIIGGTSVGALIAACYAIDLSTEAAYQRFYNIVVNSKGTMGWRSLTWPVASLFSGKNYTNALKDVFGDLLIEEMWIPYFCISSNVSTHAEVVHTQGLVWEKNRASTSLPGILPPMVINGEMHVDGGLLNNLPVDVMRQFVDVKGKIIAVELNSYSPEKKKYSFPPIMTLGDVMLSKMDFTQSKTLPNFMDTFLRGLFVGSVYRARQNSLGADIFISLNLSAYPMLNANPLQARILIDIGYLEYMKKINHKKRDNPDIST